MKVYCAPLRNDGYTGPLARVLKRKNEWKTWPGMQKHDCNECKHKFVCLLDPGCSREFKKTV